MHLAPGTLVTPRLRLVRELGRGGMGAVWVAENLALETEVAVKFILTALGGQTAALDRFQREARLAAQLKSPHLAQIFDHGVTDDGTPYIVMELLAGRSLADRLAGGATLAVGETLQVVEQLARALGAAHRGGVVHRDIKPENVFLLDLPDARDGELHVKLLDFGVARSFAEAGSSHLTEGPIGTPAYMSPEQLHDSASVGAASDLWSLAVLAYRALVGHPPFTGPSAVALWKAIAARSYAAPSTEVPGLPPELDAWFQRAFALEPGDRFPSARALADELGRCFPEQVLASAVRATSSGARDAGAGTGDRAENAELGTAQFVASAALGIDLERAAPGEPGAAAATGTRGTDTQPSAGVGPAAPGPSATGPGTTGSGASLGGAAATLPSGSRPPARSGARWSFAVLGAVALGGAATWLVTRDPGGVAPTASATATAADDPSADPSTTAAPSGSAPTAAQPLRQPTLGLRTLDDFRDPKGSTVSLLRSASLWSAAARDLAEAAAQPGAPVRWRAGQHFAEAEQALTLGKTADAVAAFQKAVATDDGWAVAHAGLASGLAQQGDLAGALAAAERAQQLDPGWWGAVTAAATAYSAAGRADEAIQEFRRALALAPKNPVLLAEVALAYHAAGNDAAADRFADEALALDPELVPVRLLRAERALERGDGKVALEEASLATAVAPKSLSARLAEADALGLLGRRAEALAAYVHVLELAKEGGVVGAPKGRIEAVEAALARKELPPPRARPGAPDAGRAARAAPAPKPAHEPAHEPERSRPAPRADPFDL